jgi:hypothetical protein
MSADSYSSIYYLTRDGWVKGPSGQYLTEKDMLANTPRDTLITLEYNDHQTSMYSRPDRTIRALAISQYGYAAAIRALLTHGMYPDCRETDAANRYNHDLELSALISQCVLNKKTQANKGAD